jgi:sugar/nucleoside kinase (ribokinase family)
MFDVITFGSATRDVFVRSRSLELHKEHGATEACFLFGAKLEVEEIAFETGGGATNNAVSFARMGKLKTAAVTNVGDDYSGLEIIEALKNDRVDARFVKRLPKTHTSYSTVLLSGIAERTILTYRGPAAHLSVAQIPWPQMNAKVFHVSGLSGNLPLLAAILARAERIGAKVFMNPGGGEFKQPASKLHPLLKRLDLLDVNREEASKLTGAPLADLGKLVNGLRKLCAHSIMTDGRAGAYAITAHDILHAGIVPVKRVNLTGAGDAFGSGYAAAILKHHDIRTALAVGTLNATGVVQHTGAKVGILHSWPSAADINRVKISKIHL